jgi:hypothetical protein
VEDFGGFGGGGGGGFGGGGFGGGNNNRTFGGGNFGGGNAGGNNRNNISAEAPRWRATTWPDRSRSSPDPDTNSLLVRTARRTSSG